MNNLTWCSTNNYKQQVPNAMMKSTAVMKCQHDLPTDSCIEGIYPELTAVVKSGHDARMLYRSLASLTR